MEPCKRQLPNSDYPPGESVCLSKRLIKFRDGNTKGEVTLFYTLRVTFVVFPEYQWQHWYISTALSLKGTWPIASEWTFFCRQGFITCVIDNFFSSSWCNELKISDFRSKNLCGKNTISLITLIKRDLLLIYITFKKETVIHFQFIPVLKIETHVIKEHCLRENFYSKKLVTISPGEVVPGYDFSKRNRTRQY
jgi:hypothetical protein